MRTFRIACVSLWLIVVAVAPSSAADGETVIVTALPFTYSVASALTAGTSIVVMNVPEGGRRMNLLGDLFIQRGDRFADDLQRAAAVITIGKLWADDPLYTAARLVNIRVIDIDATKPWSPSLEGISIVAEPTTDARWAATATEPAANSRPSVFFWLSLANAARAAEIVGRDLMRLVPSEAAAIESNLLGYRNAILDLKRAVEKRLAEAADLTVFSLAPEFVYMTNELGIFVDGYYLKPEAEWTADDLVRFSAYLHDNAIRVVIHKWVPDESVVRAIDAGGARLVMLDPIDLGIVEDGRLAADGYLRLMRQNSAALSEALAATD